MTSNRRLFAPLPPGVDKSNPEIIHWRLDQHEEAIQSLSDTKVSWPANLNPSLLKAGAVAALYALGLIGLLSPDRAQWLIGLLSSR
jgi:hypothetical protein